MPNLPGGPARGARERGDATVASEVVGRMDAAALADLESKVPASEVMESNLLSYRPERVPKDEVDSPLVFAFGNRVAADGSVQYLSTRGVARQTSGG